MLFAQLFGFGVLFLALEMKHMCDNQIRCLLKWQEMVEQVLVIWQELSSGRTRRERQSFCGEDCLKGQGVRDNGKQRRGRHYPMNQRN